MPAASSRAKKKTLTIGGKDYEFKPAPVAVMLMSQLRGDSTGITNMDATKWVLRSLKPEDAAEVLTKFESGEIDFVEFSREVVPAAMEMDNTRPTS